MSTFEASLEVVKLQKSKLEGDYASLMNMWDNQKRVTTYHKLKRSSCVD